jgi:carboxyl-terminal processing protease
MDTSADGGKWKIEDKCETCSKIAYIRLSQFGDQTNKEWTSLVNNLDLQIQQDKSVKGLILDLRNNPGGYLTDAVFIASEFLGVGKTVVLEEGHDNKKTSFVTRKGLLTKIPLIILINKGSASASEILAAAMTDNNRGILVGETSFGKGTIQMADDLGSGAGLHITIAKWLTPKGIWVNGKGLKPDIEVKPDDKDQGHDAQLEKAVEELIK